jgi:hypothetical protein
MKKEFEPHLSHTHQNDGRTKREREREREIAQYQTLNRILMTHGDTNIGKCRRRGFTHTKTDREKNTKMHTQGTSNLEKKRIHTCFRRRLNETIDTAHKQTWGLRSWPPIHAPQMTCTNHEPTQGPDHAAIQQLWNDARRGPHEPKQAQELKPGTDANDSPAPPPPPHTHQNKQQKYRWLWSQKNYVRVLQLQHDTCFSMSSLSSKAAKYTSVLLADTRTSEAWSCSNFVKSGMTVLQVC